MSYKSVTQILYHKKCVLYQIPLSTTYAVYYGALTERESNTPFPVTKQQFRMMCDKDVLQLLLEDLNKATSPMKVNHNHVS
jgi:hypothetical protein